MREVFLIGVLLSGVGLCLGGKAFAFKLNISNWSYMIHPIAEELVICPAGMPDSAVQRTKDGALPWNYERLLFTFGPENCVPNEGMATATLNSVNQIDFGPLPASLLANTVTWAVVDSNGAGAETTVECDIRFNNARRWYTGTGNPARDQFDWQSVATHELGHCLGLAHEDSVTPPPVMRTVLPSGTVVRQLTADDLAGRNAIYDQPRVEPSPAPPVTTSPAPATTGGGSSGGGGCSLSSGSSAVAAVFYGALGNSALPVAVLILLRGWSRRQTLMKPARP